MLGYIRLMQRLDRVLLRAQTGFIWGLARVYIGLA